MSSTLRPRIATGPRFPGDPAWWRGLALTGAVAGAALLASLLPWTQRWGLGALTLAILLGIVVGNTVLPTIADRVASGVDFSKGTLLRAGIVLYGVRIAFQQIADVGWTGAAIDALMVATVFPLAVALGTRLLGLDRQTAMLIGAGSAICGAAAVIAAEPVVRAPAHKVSVAVATVVVFGTLSMFAYPWLYPHLGLSEHAYGVYVGSTVHEVAQVVVAGRGVSDTAAATAVIEKMMRVMLLAPFLLALSAMLRGTRASADRAPRLAIPWFAVAFVAVSGVHSLGILPAWSVDALVRLDTALLTLAMAALGLRTHLGAVRQAGAKPLALAALLFVYLVVGGYAINRGIAWLCG